MEERIMKKDVVRQQCIYLGLQKQLRLYGPTVWA